MKTLIVLIVLIALITLSGCALKPITPYTNSEKAWLGIAVAGQAADYASTRSAINRGCSEGNSFMYGNDPSDSKILAMKVATGGLIYFAANAMSHENRSWFLPVASVIGFGPAIYNTTLDCN